MNINVVKTIVYTVITVVLSILIISNIPWLILMIGGQLSTNPPVPQIQHGEFSFRLEYEIDGQKFEVRDVLICDFDGFGFSTGSGEKYRKWKAKLKSGKNRITLQQIDDVEILFFPVKADSNVGGTYMGDNGGYYPEEMEEIFPDALYTSNFEDKTVNEYIISAEDMWEKYKIKLISWEIAPPIKNEFK